MKKQSKPGAYTATPEHERELARTGRVSFTGGRYGASVIPSALGQYEAYTDTLPYVYGQMAGTVQGALDNLEAAFVEQEPGGERRAS